MVFQRNSAGTSQDSLTQCKGVYVSVIIMINNDNKQSLSNSEHIKRFKRQPVH
jgi:hypothetical protein